MAKSALAGELAKAGWRVIDTNSFPVTLSGEDLNEYLIQKDGKTGAVKKSSISATVKSDGSFSFSSKNDESLISGARMNRMQWRIDLDKVVAEAKGAGADYVIYGEVTANPVTRGGPEEFTSEGYTSCLAIANLRLIDAGTRNVVTTFTEQIAGMQVNKESAGLEAIKNAGKRAGAFFVKEMAGRKTATENVAQ